MTSVTTSFSLSKLTRRRVTYLAVGVALVAVGAWAGAQRTLPGASAAARAPAATVIANVRSAAGIHRLETGLTSRVQHAYVPPQCYTKTRAADGNIANPCFTCHTKARAPNYVSDEDLQQSYDFPDRARHNAWRNLFVDRRPAIAATSDDAILSYVKASNYRSSGGRLLLAEKLTHLPAAWDPNGNGRWDGYVPDAYFDFDARGFDHAPSGALTGWRAFAYYPLPGTFWPTNGSMGDVLIRLAEGFRLAIDDAPDQDVYELNLAIVEALITRHDVPIEERDERVFGVDLDLDGRLGTARRVAFQWQPGRGTRMAYVGRAGELLKAGELKIVAGLFPEGTEFLHSVRYLDVVAGKVEMAPRFKELRYARKTHYAGYGELAALAFHAQKEKHDSPDRLEQFPGSFEQGLSNKQGWVLSAFIEDARGELRPQTYEETLFCMGCHGGIGATSDSTFSFARKLPPHAFRGGWFHWTQHGLDRLPEPQRADGRYEYTLYLEQNRAGDELRANTEVAERFFDERGALRAARVAALHQDIGSLLVPSPARALALDKAYQQVVLEQSFSLGRDAVLAPAVNVYDVVEPDQTTGVFDAVAPGWLGASG